MTLRNVLLPKFLIRCGLTTVTKNPALERELAMDSWYLPVHSITPKESQSKQPYVCFDLVERSGGEHPNFYQVWARGDQVARLTRLKVKKGSMIWLTGSQKLVDVRQKDGATVKKLKVWLTDFGFLPGQSSRAKAEHEQHDSDAAATAPAPSEVMDGDRESLPE